MYIIDLSLRKEYRYIHANIRKFKFIFAGKVKMKKRRGVVVERVMLMTVGCEVILKILTLI